MIVRSPRWLTPWAGLSGLFLVLLAALVVFVPTQDPDIWWHLRIGEQALRTRSTLPREPFAFAFLNQPWPYKDLAAEVLLFGVFQALGYAGFFLMKLAAALGIALALGAATPPERRHPAALLLCGGLAVLTLPLLERPNLFSLLAFPLLLAACARLRREADDARAWRRLLPVLLLLTAWAWLHRAVLVGYVCLGLLALTLALRRALAAPRWDALLGPRPHRAMLLAALGAAALAPLLGLTNPSGAALFHSGVGVAQSAMLRRYITEWLPSDPVRLAQQPAGWVLLAGALVLLLRLARGRQDLLQGGLLVLFLVRLLWDSVRWQPYAVLCALWILQDGLGGLLAQRPRLPRGLAALTGVALLGLHLSTRDAPLRLGESDSHQAPGAVAFARAAGLRGPVLNAYGLGGYLIYRLWPEAQVLADGRCDLVYPAEFVALAIDAGRDPGAFAELRRRPGLGAAGWVMAWNRPDLSTHRFLYRDPAWALVYWDDVAAIYVQREAHPQLAERAYRLIDPWALEASVARLIAQHQGDAALLRALLGELQRLFEAAPRSLRACGALLIYYSKMGPAFAPQRDALLRHLDEVAPDDPGIRRLRAHLGLPSTR